MLCNLRIHRPNNARHGSQVLRRYTVLASAYVALPSCSMTELKQARANWSQMPGQPSLRSYKSTILAILDSTSNGSLANKSHPQRIQPSLLTSPRILGKPHYSLNQPLEDCYNDLPYQNFMLTRAC